MRIIAFALTVTLTACAGGDAFDDDGGALPPGGPGGPGGPGPGGGGDAIDYGIPSEYPQLNARWASHAVWAVDHSGAELIPNRWVASVGELAISEGAETYGAIWDPSYGAFAIEFTDRDDDQRILIRLPALDARSYEVSGFDGELLYEERGGYRYTTAIEGGRGSVIIDGANDRALWGRFSGRTCFVSTPGSNCFSHYEGRFSALDQRPE
jgi:hypothetical protein